MSEDSIRICQELALLKVIHKMNAQYNGVAISKEQLFSFYKENYDPSSFEEIVSNGTW